MSTMMITFLSVIFWMLCYYRHFFILLTNGTSGVAMYRHAGVNKTCGLYYIPVSATCYKYLCDFCDVDVNQCL